MPAPAPSRLASTVLPAATSRTNTSGSALASPATRFVAALENAMRLPSAEIDGAPTGAAGTDARPPPVDARGAVRRGARGAVGAAHEHRVAGQVVAPEHVDEAVVVVRRQVVLGGEEDREAPVLAHRDGVLVPSARASAGGWS